MSEPQRGLFKKSFKHHVLQAGNHFAEFSSSVFPPDVLQMQLAHKCYVLFFQRGGEGRAVPPMRAWVPAEGAAGVQWARESPMSFSLGPVW